MAIMTLRMNKAYLTSGGPGPTTHVRVTGVAKVSEMCKRTNAVRLYRKC